MIKSSHSINIGTRKAGQIRKFPLQFGGEFVDDGGAPAFVFLFGDDGAADVPVELDEFAVDGEGGADLGGADAVLEVGEEGGVACEAAAGCGACRIASVFSRRNFHENSLHSWL